MTASDDGSRDEPPPGHQDPRTEPELPELPFDEEAAWREIVENYGERPASGGGSAGPDTTGLSPFDRSYLDSLDARLLPLEDRADDRADSRRRPAADDADEGLPDPTDHFVPPEPPPIPRGTPARRLAWAGLLGSPVALLVAVFVHMLTGWVVPTLLTLGVAAAFVGGFVFLVATMPRDRGDGWDDGAVL
jgi:hypothetical protein